MFGIGLSEIILIVIIAVIFIEPEKLPGIAKAIGKAFIEFRRAGEELKRNIKEAETDIINKARAADEAAKAAVGAAESKPPQSAPEAEKPAEPAEKKA
jgi:Sec-independent protein translocase protein TatA